VVVGESAGPEILPPQELNNILNKKIFNAHTHTHTHTNKNSYFFLKGR